MRKGLGFLLIAVVAYWIFFVYERPLAPSDARLRLEFMEWQETLADNGIQIKPSHRALTYETLPTGRVGRTNYRTQTVSLDYSVVDPWLVKATLWHELGHLYFSLDHNSCRIMDERAHPADFYKDRWPELEKEYIKLIKQKQ